jgi:hypothetical protein
MIRTLDPHMALYLGNYRSSGRYCWDAHWHDVPLDKLKVLVTEPLVEGIFNPSQMEGDAQVHQLGGWAVLAFANRTDDSREDSSSVFFLRGIHDFFQSVEFARGVFPQVWMRFSFDVTETQHPRVPGIESANPTLF